MDIIKMVLTGDIATGKTSIINRFVEGTFTEAAPSIICESLSKEMKIDGKEFTMELWDTAGQERFRTVTSSFYKGAKLVAFVFDISKKETFANLEHWLTEVDRCAAENAEKVLIGNKTDLDNRAVSQAEAQEYAESLGLSYYEMSAKTGVNVEAAFEAIIRALTSNDDDIGIEVKTHRQPTKKKSSGCGLL